MSLRNTFHVELLRIPKSVRQMSLRAFCQQYGEVSLTLENVKKFYEAYPSASDRQRENPCMYDPLELRRSRSLGLMNSSRCHGPAGHQVGAEVSGGGGDEQGKFFEHICVQGCL